MKRIYIKLFLLLISISGFAQQKPQYSQYMINPFVMNPAVSGTEDYGDIRVGYRNQWVGFPGAPKTFYLSGHVPLGKGLVVNNRTKHKKNGFHGVGGLITNDVTGPTRRFTLNAAYSYHMTLAKKLYASVGLMGGIQQFTLDGSMLTTANPGDPAISSSTSTSLADINAGFWIYSDKFYIGGALTQVMRQTIYNYSATTGTTVANSDRGRLSHHYFLTAGYRIPIDDDFTFIPSFLIKAVNPAPVSFDLNCKVRYRDLLWAGVSYRRQDAVAAMAGVVINEMFDVSYSYDFITSSMRRYTSGSHEIVVGYRWKLNQAMRCPSHYW
ncbi:MAG: type IX secretion system membrane protein PorP/SprF [Cytophagaceae bacterium]